MDQEDRERLIRIEANTENMAVLFSKHVDQDRQDFKEVHSRINDTNSRVGKVVIRTLAIVISACTAAATVVITILKM